jgi:hypothetical protein
LLELLLTDVLPVVEQRRAVEKVEFRIRHAAKLYRPHAHAASSWIATEAEAALLAVTVALVKLGWIAAPVKPAEIIAEDD